MPLSDLACSSLHSFGDSHSPVFGPDGELLAQHEADELQGLFWKLIDRATEHSKAHKASIPADKSLYDYGLEAADDLFGGAAVECGAGTPASEPVRVRWKGQEQRKALWLDMLHMFVAQILRWASSGGVRNRGAREADLCAGGWGWAGRSCVFFKGGEPTSGPASRSRVSSSSCSRNP